MKTFQKLLPLLNETNPELENRKTIATIFHTKFHELLYFFDRNDSLFKKFALTSSPLLVSFSYMIALFTPIAKKLIPQVEKNTQLACKMRDVLEPYVPLVVYERLSRHIYAYGVEHNHAFLFKVMAKPFNENGYNTELRIDEGCDGGWMEYYDTHGEHCLYDDLNEVRYHYPANQAETAYVDYGSLVRHRVEEYFPMKTLKSLCVGATSKTKTGFGWVTIIISEVFAYSLPNGDDCDSLGDRCDPYVKLFVDGEMVQSAPRSNTNRFDPDLSFVSKKLTKEKTIKIELWDDDSTAFGRGSDDLIFRTEGTVESFLKDGKRSSGKSKGVTQSHANEVYLIAIWRDEYK
ncbi:uncharacterized protein LOC119078623 [Bradysia coprophila]|uniref:uncharacterized protein LOC119078623 n=1 Tax=Bradysia coprophila TaxID=38358 RepID=UPI00187DBA73|nr:uncharacterized protein LOC119078623 [Bradysia coprophila]